MANDELRARVDTIISALERGAEHALNTVAGYAEQGLNDLALLVENVLNEAREEAYRRVDAMAETVGTEPVGNKTDAQKAREMLNDLADHEETLNPTVESGKSFYRRLDPNLANINTLRYVWDKIPPDFKRFKG